MGIWTLNCNGTEHDFPTWGIKASISIELVNKGKWIAIIPTTEAYDAASPQFAYGNPITIWQNRTAVGSGGHIYFQGWVANVQRVNEDGEQGIVYQCHDIWWRLERESFHQVRNAATNYNATTGAITYGSPQFLVETYLGEIVNLSGVALAFATSGAEISEILSWLNECWNPTRQGAAYTGGAGSIDPTQDIVNFWGRPGMNGWVPAVGLPSLPGTTVDSGNSNAVMDPQALIPVTRTQNLLCAESIINMLRYSPSVVVNRDFTTSPMTLHFRDQLGANALSLVTITLSAAQEKEIKTRAENERVLPGVCIEYRRITTINGAPFLAYLVDNWPLATSFFTPEELCLFVELQGGSVTEISADVEVVPVANATSGVGSTQQDFWGEYEPLLFNNPNISGISFDNTTFTVEAVGSNSAINTTTYPNVLLPKSSISPWMTAIVVTDAVLTIGVTFTQTNDGGQTSHQVKRKIHARVKMTNAVTQTYTAVTHADEGEPFPATGASGLAKQIYAGLSTLTYSGTITILESQLASGDLIAMVPGAPLKFIGPSGGVYTNCFVQEVICRPHFGELQIRYGPAARLEARDLVDLYRCTRERFVYDMPSGRDTGQPGGGSTVDATTDIGIENTSAPPGDNTYHGLWS